jgi:hypothetical protein
MPSTMRARELSMECKSIDDVRPQMAKASLDGQSTSIAMGAVVKDALLRHYGSLKAAAITLRIDQGQLTRELQSGDFKVRQLDKDPDAKAFVSEALHEAYGTCDPLTQARRKLREARQRIDEAMEVIA